MAFRVEQPDSALSPMTGMTRRHWLDAARFLLDGVFQHVQSDDAPIVLPKQHEITYPRPNDPPWRFKSAEFEGLARTLMLAAPVLAIEPDLTIRGRRLRDYYAGQLLLATDPKSPRYLGTLTEIIQTYGLQQYQHTVEGAALVIGLMACREQVWAAYSRKERDQIARVISDYGHRRTIGHNWRYFNVLMLSFLKVQGYPVDETVLADHIQHLLSYYVGDGWYRDDETFDFYNPWGFQFYGPIWCSWYGYDHMPEAAALIEERNALFMREYPRFFSRRGHQLMWGRSIIYRCAASAAFGASFLLRRTEADPGWSRRVASANLLEFLGRDDVYLNGVPCLGYFGPFAPLVQFYSCAASPFWLAKTFLALTLPENSPFWTAPERNGVWERIGQRTDTIFLQGPGIEVVNHGSTGTTEILTAKAPKRDPFYCQLAYNTDFPWEAEAPEGATAMTYSLRETGSGDKFRAPLRMGFYREEGGVLYRQFNTKPEGLGDPNKGGINKGPEKIDLADIIIPGGVIRVDRVRIPYCSELQLANYGLPHLEGKEAEVRPFEVSGKPGIAATIAGRRVALVAYRGWDGVAAMRHVGRHPEAEASTVIYAHRTRQKDYQGMELLVTVLLHRADNQAWTERDLSPIVRAEFLPWSPSGSPWGARLELTDGRRIEVDFREIESVVCH